MKPQASHHSHLSLSPKAAPKPLHQCTNEMSSLELSAGALQLSLIDAYIIDLQDTFTQVLGPGTTFIGPTRCCALLGGEIVTQIDQLPAGVALSDAADKFDQIAQYSRFIVSSWMEDDSLHAKVSPTFGLRSPEPACASPHHATLSERAKSWMGC